MSLNEQSAPEETKVEIGDSVKAEFTQEKTTVTVDWTRFPCWDESDDGKGRGYRVHARIPKRCICTGFAGLSDASSQQYTRAPQGDDIAFTVFSTTLTTWGFGHASASPPPQFSPQAYLRVASPVQTSHPRNGGKCSTMTTRIQITIYTWQDSVRQNMLARTWTGPQKCLMCTMYPSLGRPFLRQCRVTLL